VRFVMLRAILRHGLGADGREELSLFDELRAIQTTYGYISADQLHKLSKKLEKPVSELHAVASFYPHFYLKPPPKADVRVCADMSCHLRGAPQLRQGLENFFAGRAATEIAIRDVSCLGRCDTAPALSVNDQIYSGVGLPFALEIIQAAITGHRPQPSSQKHAQRQLKADPYQGRGSYKAVQQFVRQSDVAAVLNALKTSTLRGMGGAGFPTGSKWEIVRNASGTQKYVVCNADESEPGTIKDRFIMENVPHLVIEGMIMAGLVTGATKGFIYIRHEYEEQREVLQEEIRRCYRERILGKGILGSQLQFDLEIFVSPGGYICGEESALLEAMEGKRAEPRNKPPFPGTHGLWNAPTVINNVETFAFATAILVNGADWYKQQGLHGVPGLKFVGISGDVVCPGVYEVPMGVSYRDLIFNYGGGVPDGKKLLGFAPSGPSSGYLPSSMVNLPLDFKALADAGSMVGSGAIVVCAEGRCMLDMAANSTRFFRNESCGKCVPCRAGSQKLVDILTRWTNGKSDQNDLELVEQLFKAMRLTSICGLGQVVHTPLSSVLKHFPAVIDDHLKARRCSAGVCFQGRG
jgi:NADH:ubiquinone oxidoreductase subunit F (NADH-binding)/NADH:ubiquinone oxidoreductase subunit E